MNDSLKEIIAAITAIFGLAGSVIAYLAARREGGSGDRRSLSALAIVTLTSLFFAGLAALVFLLFASPYSPNLKTFESAVVNDQRDEAATLNDRAERAETNRLPDRPEFTRSPQPSIVSRASIPTKQAVGTPGIDDQKAASSRAIHTVDSTEPKSADRFARYASAAKREIANGLLSVDEATLVDRFEITCSSATESRKQFSGYGIQSDLVVVEAIFLLKTKGTVKSQPAIHTLRVAPRFQAAQYSGLNSDHTIEAVVKELKDAIQKNPIALQQLRTEVSQ